MSASFSSEPQWLLRGGVGADGSGDEATLAMCVDVEGLFVDLPREHFTLMGCNPAGTLADLLDRLPAEAFGTERAWLGNVAVTGTSWPTVELGDVVVLAQRQNAANPGAVDIDLGGFVLGGDRAGAVTRPHDPGDLALLDDNEMLCGTCGDVTGVGHERAAPPVRQVRFLGCQPEPALMPALDAVGQPTKAAMRRRWVSIQVHTVATDGSAVEVIGAAVSGTVAAATPSSLGDGLVDVTVDMDQGEPLPSGVADIVAQWRTGRPSQLNTWAGYDRRLRHHWAGAALSHRPDAPDRSPGATYELDGRFVTDIEGFYCAIGEAINGPGGYFGWNLDALVDCLRGGFGAQPPFRLVWHNSATARTHLRAGHDRHRQRPATALDDLLDIFTAHGIDIDQR